MSAFPGYLSCLIFYQLASHDLHLVWQKNDGIRNLFPNYKRHSVVAWGIIGEWGGRVSTIGHCHVLGHLPVELFWSYTCLVWRYTGSYFGLTPD